MIQKLKRSAMLSPCLKKREKVAFGSGNILQELTGMMWYFYSMIYLTRVEKLSNGEAGLVMLVSQGSEAILTPFAGHACDKLNLKLYGKKKFCLLLSSILILVSWPFLFNLCLVGKDASSTVKLAYYCVFGALFASAYGIGDAVHFSLIPDISYKKSDIVDLSSIR